MRLDLTGHTHGKRMRWANPRRRCRESEKQRRWAWRDLVANGDGPRLQDSETKRPICRDERASKGVAGVRLGRTTA